MELVKSEARLKNILVSDKEENPLKIINVLKSDLINTLKNYMDVSYDDLDVNITINEYGQFVFSAYLVSRRLKNLSAIIE
ncbi:MAG: cell division topological specificity factor MinE [Clostridia bacterium]|nr:cell division topological specificity factor MinE [Clostridia bacterium]